MAALGSYISSVFLAPQFWAFLGLVPVIIILYLLKLRRTEVVISSTFLWMKSLQDLTANAPFQKLRKNLLMFLQILATILLVIALMRPFIESDASGGANYCLIIDSSASMQTEEDGKTRLDLAKEKALAMIDGLSRGDKLMIVAFARSADVLCELTEDRYRMRRAVNDIQPKDSETSLRDVLLITRSLSSDNIELPSAIPNLRLVLFSDGNLAGLDDTGPKLGNLTYVRVGETTDNVGIVRFSVREPEDADTQQTFLLVENAGDAEVQTTLTLYYNDEAIAVEEVTVAAKAAQEVIFSHGALQPGILRAELDREDALAIDNAAWLSIRPETKVRTLVVTDPNSTSGYFLKRALALEPRVELSAVAPGSYAPTNDYDLVIFDGHSPEALPPGTSVFFNGIPPIEGLSLTEPQERPSIVSFDSEHPAMRFLNLSKLSVAEARMIAAPEGSRTIVSSGASVVAADVSRGGRQLLVFGFDIARSNWPTLLSFPLFLQNLVTWTPQSGAAAEMDQQAGAPLSIWPYEGATEATVYRPDGDEETLALEANRPAYYGNTETVGVYTVEQEGSVEAYAVNLLDPNESRITPRDSIELGRGEIASVGDDFLRTKELWRWFIVAAIVILCGEWWLYSRRAWM